MDAETPLLQVRELKTWFGSRRRPIRAVDGVSLDVPPRSTVALVGESGCGKSVTALSLARLVPEPPGFYAGGDVLFDGRSVLKMSQAELSGLRGREISYIFQEPATSLNPVFRVGAQIMEAVRLHRPSANARDEAGKLLQRVGLPEPQRQLNAYPHQMSGGMQQRVMIAMALACRPRLLVADEPTTALDVTIQAQILALLSDLQRDLDMSVLLITHNLGLVADQAHTVSVMYAGRIVESGPTGDVLRSPAHPYAKALLEAVPRLGSAGGRMTGIPGTVPDPADLPRGCKFSPRCTRVQPLCREQEPALATVEPGRDVRCFFPCGRSEDAVTPAGQAGRTG